MIDSEYLPPDFKFRDPSKMKKAHYQLLLEYWYKRQQNPDVDTVFAFKGFWDHGSNSVVAAYKKQSNGRKQLKRPKRSKKDKGTKAGGKRSGPPGVRMGDLGWISLSEEEDEGEENENSHEDESEEEDSHLVRRKLPPRPLPFSAPRRNMPNPTVPKKRRKTKVRKEVVIGEEEEGSEEEENDHRKKRKSTMQDKRPLPQPAF